MGVTALIAAVKYVCEERRRRGGCVCVCGGGGGGWVGVTVWVLV